MDGCLHGRVCGDGAAAVTWRLRACAKSVGSAAASARGRERVSRRAFNNDTSSLSCWRLSNANNNTSPLFSKAHRRLFHPNCTMVSSAQGPPFDGSRHYDQHPYHQQHSDAHSSHQISSPVAAQQQNFLAQWAKSHDYNQGEVCLRNASLKRHGLSREVLEYTFSEVANDDRNRFGSEPN